MATNKKPGNWKKRTLAVRAGTQRTEFQETSEALFLTSGYAYEEAEEAEARFKGEIGGFQYSRFGNPTVSMSKTSLAMRKINCQSLSLAKQINSPVWTRPPGRPPALTNRL